MTDKPMTEDERVVREACESVSADLNEDGDGYNVLLNGVINLEGVRLAMNGVISPIAFLTWFRCKSRSAAYAAAAEFIHNRQQEIAEVEKEIKVISKQQVLAIEWDVWQRVMGRERTAWEDLRRGMK
jgi:hypothetical protein